MIPRRIATSIKRDGEIELRIFYPRDTISLAAFVEHMKNNIDSETVILDDDTRYILVDQRADDEDDDNYLINYIIGQFPTLEQAIEEGIIQNVEYMIYNTQGELITTFRDRSDAYEQPIDLEFHQIDGNNRYLLILYDNDEDILDQKQYDLLEIAIKEGRRSGIRFIIYDTYNEGLPVISGNKD